MSRAEGKSSVSNSAFIPSSLHGVAQGAFMAPLTEGFSVKERRAERAEKRSLFFPRKPMLFLSDDDRILSSQKKNRYKKNVNFSLLKSLKRESGVLRREFSKFSDRYVKAAVKFSAWLGK